MYSTKYPIQQHGDDVDVSSQRTAKANGPANINHLASTQQRLTKYTPNTIPMTPQGGGAFMHPNMGMNPMYGGMVTPQNSNFVISPQGRYLPTPPQGAATVSPFNSSFGGTQPGMANQGGPVTVFTTKKAIYQVGDTIQRPPPDGHGMSDGIRMVRDQRGKVFVEKRLKVTSADKLDRAEAEKKVLRQIVEAGGHDNINYLYDTIFDPTYSHGSLVLEFCDQGTLEQYRITNQHNMMAIPEDFCWHILSQLCAALSMLHLGIRDPLKSKCKIQDWNTICHLDIKLTNILLSSKRQQDHENDVYPRVVLCDLGCAVTRDDIRTGKIAKSVQPYGTEGWFPPENDPSQRTGKANYGKPTDIWQMGGVIQTLCRGTMNPNTALVDQRRACGSKYSNLLNNVIFGCMVKDPKIRPSSVDVGREVGAEMEKRGMLVRSG